MNTIRIENAEFLVSATIDTFVTIFQNPGKPVSMSISLSGSGAPFASTQKIPAGALNRAWYEQARDANGNIIPGRATSKFPLRVTYSGLKHGTKSKTALFVNVQSVTEAPIVSETEANDFFAGFGEPPKTQTPEQANAAAQSENDEKDPF